MDTRNFATSFHPALQQLHTNAYAWLGHMTNSSDDHVVGQTFDCPYEIDVERIQVFSSAVAHPGKVILTLHSFDKENKSWGPVLSTSELEVDDSKSESWLEFRLPPTHLRKNDTYGFRLNSSDALVAVGEVAWTNGDPQPAGEEFHEDSENQRFFRYFSLAYKVGLRA